jgi:hypothetical protein
VSETGRRSVTEGGDRATAVTGVRRRTSGLRDEDAFADPPVGSAKSRDKNRSNTVNLYSPKINSHLI